MVSDRPLVVRVQLWEPQPEARNGAGYDEARVFGCNVRYSFVNHRSPLVFRRSHSQTAMK